jgi:hypothetical protein
VGEATFNQTFETGFPGGSNNKEAIYTVSFANFCMSNIHNRTTAAEKFEDEGMIIGMLNFNGIDRLSVFNKVCQVFEFFSGNFPNTLDKLTRVFALMISVSQRA